MNVRFSTYYLWITAFLFSTCVRALSQSNSSDEERLEKWYKERLYEFAEIQKLPKEQQIPLLGQPLGIRKPYFAAPTGRRLEIFEIYQSALLAIPGHAEYFGNKLVRSHEKYRLDVTKGVKGSSTHEYLNDTMYCGRALGSLPSVETVRVLGEMLSNTWVYENADPGERPSSLAGISTFNLHRLPIRNKPTAHWKYITTGNIDEAMALWQKWYQQVKDGRRTFSFEGDPNEYSLTGPVGTAKDPDVPRVVKRPVATGAEKTSPRSPSETHVPLLLWVAAIIAAIGGGIYFVMGRSRFS